MVIVTIDPQKLNKKAEYVRISETFNKITKCIQLYQHKVKEANVAADDESAWMMHW